MVEKFSFDTIQDFDTHIELSVPNYVHLVELVKNLSTHFVRDDTYVYDLGCSTGKLVEYLSTLGVNATFVGIDNSENLLPKDTEVKKNLRYDYCDVRQYKFHPTSFAISIFTLQFLPLCDRVNLLKRIREVLLPEGALVVAEKVYMDTGLYQDIFTFTYYDFKRTSFKADEILAKQVDLRGVMRPLSVIENEQMFEEAGFDHVQFFRSLNFVGWLLIPIE